ncbi:MAG: cytochrome C [Cyanobacteria bacterium SBLK]|nr:cytochrome C [Cyanobacteria bacterium SBLK]
MHGKRNRRDRSQKKSRQKSPWILLGLIVFWSLAIGFGIAVALGTNRPVYSQSPEQMSFLKSVDPVPEGVGFARDVYVDRCGECHIALPTEILPTESWRSILQELPQHYNTTTRQIISPEIILMWNYIQLFSRTYGDSDDPPFRIDDSRYFRALHPKVNFQQIQTANTCTTCHDRASEFNFRSLREGI